MPQPPKPGVDWPKIKQQWVRGATQAKLAAENNVSNVAISKRIKREGWTRAPSVTFKQQTAVIKEPWFNELVSSTFTPETAARALECARMNMPNKAIAAAIGVTEVTLYQWLKNEEFRASVMLARAESAMQNLKNLQHASDRGDVKATLTQLGANPLTAEEFRGAGASGGTQINVLVNVPRGEPGQPTTAVQINGPPQIDHE